MSEASPNRPPPEGWVESLDRAKAEIASGETVPMEPVLERLRASAERLELQRATATQGA